MQTYEDLIHWFFDRTNRLLSIVGREQNEDYFLLFCTDPSMEPVRERWEQDKQIRLRDNKSLRRVTKMGLQRFNAGLNGLLNVYWKTRVDLPKLRFKEQEEDVVLVVPKILEAVRAWYVNDEFRWKHSDISDPPILGEVEYIRDALESSDEKFPLLGKRLNELFQKLGDARSIFLKCPVADEVFSDLESVSWRMRCWYWDHEVGRDVWPGCVEDVERLRPWLVANFVGPAPEFSNNELKQLVQRYSSLVTGGPLQEQSGGLPKSLQTVVPEIETKQSSGLADCLSPDGLTLRWDGKLYPLSPASASLVKLLFDAFNVGFPYLHEEYLKTQGEFEADVRHIVRDAGLESIVVRELGGNGKAIKGKWGLIDPKKVLIPH